MDYDPFPPIEALVQEVLRAANIVDKRVYSGVPNRPQYPLITVRRIGGLPAVRRRLDRAMLQIDTWGKTKTDAVSKAQQARVTLHRMEGVKYTDFGDARVDAYVTGVTDSLGLTFLEDPVTGRDRYLFGVDVFAHSVP